MNDFWQSNESLFVLSPMDGVTDCPFRLITKKYGGNDLLYTEFINVEALFYHPEKIAKQIFFLKDESPLVVQLYGKKPELFYLTVFLMILLGFDGIDLNMGCPASKVVGNGSGAALIGNYDLVTQIINQVKKAISDFKNKKISEDLRKFLFNFFEHCPQMLAFLSNQNTLNNIDNREVFSQKMNEKEVQELIKERIKELSGKNIPLSFKTRLGFDKVAVKDWMNFLLQFQPRAIILHGRTAKQAYSGKADWEQIGLAGQIVKKTKTKFFGNGDISSREEGLEKINQYNLDGVFIGRKALGNPFVFNDKKVDIEKFFQIAIEHTQLYEKIFGLFNSYSFLRMRKYLASYARSFPEAKKVRSQLVLTNNSSEVAEILKLK
jgi:tRNA-dihydrouridine synthase